MQKVITGRAYVLGDNVDTDQIIPAEFLSYNPSDPAERRFFGKHANSGVPAGQAGLPGGDVPFVDPDGDGFTSSFKVIVAGRNFGCGSSREHAPLALAEAGVAAVVADFYARIFFRNSVNGGYLLPLQSTRRLVEETQTGDEVEVDLDGLAFRNVTRGTEATLEPLGDVLPIVEAGGVFAYARQGGDGEVSKDPRSPPIRTRGHVVADLGVNHVERQVLLAGHAVYRTAPDYGTDLRLQYRTPAEVLTPFFVSVQVKASDSPRYARSGKSAGIQIDRGHLEYWRQHERPVLLALYDVGRHVAYWTTAAEIKMPGEMVMFPTVRFDTTRVVTPEAADGWFRRERP